MNFSNNPSPQRSNLFFMVKRGRFLCPRMTRTWLLPGSKLNGHESERSWKNDHGIERSWDPVLDVDLNDFFDETKFIEPSRDMLPQHNRNESILNIHCIQIMWPDIKLGHVRKAREIIVKSVISRVSDEQPALKIRISWK